jgi:hypothetical protein
VASSTPSPSPNQCRDGEKNGDETDVDCGGSRCGPCLSGQACKTTADCIGPPATPIDTRCVVASQRCRDVRLAQAYWLTVPVLVYPVRLSLSLPTFLLSAPGLGVITDALGQAALASLNLLGVDTSVTTIAATTSLVVRSGGRRLASGSDIVVSTLDFVVLISPIAGALSDGALLAWSSPIKQAVSVGALSAISLRSFVVSRVTAIRTVEPAGTARAVAATAWNAALPAAVLTSDSSPLTLAAQLGSLEDSAIAPPTVAPPPAGGGGVGGAAAGAGIVVALLAGFAFFVQHLRSEPHLSRRYVPVATLWGVLPLRRVLGGGESGNTLGGGDGGNQKPSADELARVSAFARGKGAAPAHPASVEGVTEVQSALAIARSLRQQATRLEASLPSTRAVIPVAKVFVRAENSTKADAEEAPVEVLAVEPVRPTPPSSTRVRAAAAVPAPAVVEAEPEPLEAAPERAVMVFEPVAVAEAVVEAAPSGAAMVLHDACPEGKALKAGWKRCVEDGNTWYACAETGEAAWVPVYDE